MDDRHLRTLSAVGVLDALAVTPSSVDAAGHWHLLPDMDSAMTHARSHLVPRAECPADDGSPTILPV